MNTRALTTALVALAALSSTASAQDGWSFELRGGAALPTADVGTEDLGSGIVLDGTFGYRFMPHLGVYAGWDWVHFGPETSFAGADIDAEETGYVLGLRFEHPFSEGGPWSYWLRAGGTWNHIELENADGDLVADSGHGLGYEAAAGLAVRFAERWSLTPGARWRSLTRDIEVGTATTEVELRYVALEVGLAVRF